MDRWRSVIGLRWRPRKLTLRRKGLVALRVCTLIRWFSRTRGWAVVDVTPGLSRLLQHRDQDRDQDQDADATKHRTMTQTLV